MITRLKWAIINYAYPYFDCEDCIGVGCGYQYPCYCEYQGAAGAGGLSPNWLQRHARRLTFVRRWRAQF